MGDAPLANAGAERVQAPKTHLPSLLSWRPEDGPPPATTPDDVPSGQAVGRAAGDPGQPGEGDRRGGRGEEPPRLGPPGLGGVALATRESRSRAAGVHPQAGHGRTPPAGRTELVSDT